MNTHSTSSIVVKRGAKFLLIKRANNPGKNLWQFPGGHVDKGETIYQCAQREAIEEAGAVKIISKKPVTSITHDAELGHRHIAHVFFGKATGRIKAGSDALAAGWFTLNQIRKMKVTVYTIQVLNKLYARQL